MNRKFSLLNSERVMLRPPEGFDKLFNEDQEEDEDEKEEDEKEAKRVKLVRKTFTVNK